ncbi:MAG: YlbF family regulator [Alicyclobacillus sp.]|nr:YlbF family regulator [Alicyclobacillus sp.]
MEERILEKAERIGRMIARSDDARRFWQARAKMERNDRAQKLFEVLKLKTNHQLGLEQSAGRRHPKYQELQREIEELEYRLAEIPVAMQYKEAQAELNELMQGLMHQLLSRLGRELPVEPGPRQGCGHGPDGNGCNCGGH